MCSHTGSPPGVRSTRFKWLTTSGGGPSPAAVGAGFASVTEVQWAAEVWRMSCTLAAGTAEDAKANTGADATEETEDRSILPNHGSKGCQRAPWLPAAALPAMSGNAAATLEGVLTNAGGFQSPGSAVAGQPADAAAARESASQSQAAEGRWWAAPVQLAPDAAGLASHSADKPAAISSSALATCRACGTSTLAASPSASSVTASDSPAGDSPPSVPAVSVRF
mmetsp:Transcript_70286/g.227550  ORF Transcript_70286/g.227550 Transcript_70286/m.227550 type:complete len:223 (+) Transcript_70286:727-1395(+)